MGNNEGERFTDGRLSRRDALRRGAVLGGGLVWATPLVQVVRMSAAMAADTSGPGQQCLVYCVKWQAARQPTTQLTPLTRQPIWPASWEELGRGRANALQCPDGGAQGLPCSMDDFVVSGDAAGTLYVHYPKSCSLDPLDPTGEELNPHLLGVKCGQSIERRIPQQQQSSDYTNKYMVAVSACGGSRRRAISHIELIIRCCC